MKLTLALLAVSAAAVSFSQAALYTLNNGTGAGATGIITTGGHTFRSGTEVGSQFTGANGGISGGAGIVSFGIFSSEDFSGAKTGADLASLFTVFGSSGEFAANGTGGNRSVFSRPANATIGDVFGGKNIYLFIGNGSTYADSQEFLIVKANELFLTADDANFAVTPKTITINSTNSQVLFGSLVGNVWTTNGDTSQTPGWQMAIIPEPSAMLLGALGALGLLRRRRN